MMYLEDSLQKNFHRRARKTLLDALLEVALPKCREVFRDKFFEVFQDDAVDGFA